VRLEPSWLSIQAELCSILLMAGFDEAGDGRFEAFLNEIGGVLGHAKRRASFAVYAMGLLTDGERKSMEPIAARMCGDPDGTSAAHQRLSNFITDSRWDDRAVRQVAARYAVSTMTEREPIVSWIVDDTGFIKQGDHSVGVQRQYTGSAGKITNCQLGVSLSLTTATLHLPVDFELYLPHKWADDPARRQEARIPEHVQFKTKPELAMQMIRRAVDNDLPRGIVLGDTAYGDSVKFRRELRELGLEYGLGVNPATMVRRLDQRGRHYGKKLTVQELGKGLKLRQVTWRDGTKKRMTARFSVRRVVPAYADDTIPLSERERLWLVVEERKEPEQFKYYLCTLPESTPKQHLVRLLKERYRTEQVYRELKKDLGFDHFEGRRFPGWHHHVSVALCCYAFLVAEQARAFPPSTEWQRALAAIHHQT
jgi:SRSO17 transposase